MVQEGKKAVNGKFAAKASSAVYGKRCRRTQATLPKKQTFKTREDLRHEKSQKGIGSGISA